MQQAEVASTPAPSMTTDSSGTDRHVAQVHAREQLDRQMEAVAEEGEEAEEEEGEEDDDDKEDLKKSVESAKSTLPLSEISSPQRQEITDIAAVFSSGPNRSELETAQTTHTRTASKVPKATLRRAAQQNPKLDATENRPGADQTPPEWMMQRNRLRKDQRQRRLTLALEAGEASGDVKLSSTSDQAGGIEAMRAAIEEVDAEMQQAEVASTPAPSMTTDGSGVAQ